MSTTVERSVLKPLTTLADFGSVSSATSKKSSKETLEGQGEGSLAQQLRPKEGSKQIHVVKDYPWTPSNVSTSYHEIPYIRLIEYFTNESMVAKALGDFLGITEQGAKAALGIKGEETGRTLAPYDKIFKKDDPTNFSYWFPYFNKNSFELNTPNWQKIDGVGEAIKKGSGFFGDAVKQFTSAAIDVAQAGASAALAWQYAGVGIFDRPRLFAGHSERQITVSFPLYNTINAQDWIKNRDLIYLLMSQNHYNKRDMITGVPPVFYDIYIPGQYYCYAAAMTDIKVENLGNVRLMHGEYIVPDAYQITLTLSEMTMPSKNQFQAVIDGQARSFVNSSSILTKTGKSTGQMDMETTARNEKERKEAVKAGLDKLRARGRE